MPSDMVRESGQHCPSSQEPDQWLLRTSAWGKGGGEGPVEQENLRRLGCANGLSSFRLYPSAGFYGPVLSQLHALEL